MIKDKLDLAVEQCIEAAGHQWDSTEQQKLLKVTVVSNVNYCILICRSRFIEG